MAIRIGTFEMSTPIGTLRGAVRDDALCALGFEPWDEIEDRLARRFGEVLCERGGGGPIAACLRRYFDGEIDALRDLPVDAGGTPFERRVWAALRKIPVGTSTAYGRLATTVGTPGAARAVGTANARNPVAIVVPCHRVVREDGSLSGYAGGVHRKRWLLDHEARHAGG